MSYKNISCWVCGLVQNIYEAMHLWKCIVGCIFNSAGLIITREIPFMYGQ
jgi:hypothetical protein